MSDMLAEFDKGMKKAQLAIKMQLLEACVQSSIKILIAAHEAKNYHYLTGNTYTSYMIGIYGDNELLQTVTITEVLGVKPPTRTKLTQGVGTVSFEDYETGKIFKVYISSFKTTDEDFGENTSRKFLMSYKPNVKTGFALVFTTGTEYSVIREGIVDTVTRAFDVSPDILLRNLKNIPLPI